MEIFDVAHGTGRSKKSIHELSIKKVWASAKAPTAHSASRRSLINNISKTMMSSFPYFARDPNASASGATVHIRLAAKAAREQKIQKTVRASRITFAFARRGLSKKRTATPVRSNRNLA